MSHYEYDEWWDKAENGIHSLYWSPKLHMSLSRHLQNGVPMSPSSETCHILVTCRHVVATWQDILTHIIGGSCRVMSSPWLHVVIYQFMVIWSTLDDCFWWYNIGYAQTSLCCMYFIWNFYWITSLFSSRLTLRYSPRSGRILSINSNVIVKITNNMLVVIHFNYENIYPPPWYSVDHYDKRSNYLLALYLLIVGDIM